MRIQTNDVAFLDRMPSGIPGDLSRKEGAIVEAMNYDATNPPAAFGQFVVIDGTSHNARKVLAGDAGSAIYGILLRPFPISNTNTTDGLGTSTPNTTYPADVCKKGYVSVLLQNSTAPVKGGQVYVRTAATSGNLVQGGIEAAASGSGVSAAKSGGNTGNGVTSAITAGALAQPGVYKARVESAGTNIALWNLYDPNGNLIDSQGYSGSGQAVTFTNQQLVLTITDGSTDFVVGDGFDITVTATNVPVPNATFMGPADANGNTEIAYRM